MSVTVSYQNSCTWTYTDAYTGYLWEVYGNGAGLWTVTILTHLGGSILWQGTKSPSGAVGTFLGDTPEGTYVRTSGTDTTPTRTVAPICDEMPATNGTGACGTYTVLVSGTGTGLDGLWVVQQFTGQFFWSSSNSGGSKPSGADSGAEMVIWSDGHHWILEVDYSTLCFFKFTSRMFGTTTPPTTGWNFVSTPGSGDETLCSTPTISVSESNCPTPLNSSSSSSSSSSNSSSSSSARGCCQHYIFTVSGTPHTLSKSGVGSYASGDGWSCNFSSYVSGGITTYLWTLTSPSGCHWIAPLDTPCPPTEVGSYTIGGGSACTGLSLTSIVCVEPSSSSQSSNSSSSAYKEADNSSSSSSQSKSSSSSSSQSR